VFCSKNNGFSLLEILIVIALIAIVSAFSIPYYQQHIISAHRKAAAISLHKLAVALEQFYMANNTYKNAKIDELKITAPKHYQIEITDASDSKFSLIARPIDSQAKNDSECGALMLDSDGEKNITGTNLPEECW